MTAQLYYAARYRFPPYEADRGTEVDRLSYHTTTPAYQQPRPQPYEAVPQSAPSFSSPPFSPLPLPSALSPLLAPLTDSSLPSPDGSLSPFLLSPSLPPTELLGWPPLPASTSSQPSSSPATPAEAPPLTRRQKQRRADTQRRKRETAALEELKQLMAAAEAYTGQHAKPEEADKQQRVQVLEGGTQSMRQLLDMVQALKRTCDEQKHALAAMEAEKKQCAIAQQRWRPQGSHAAQSSHSSNKRVRLLASNVSRSLDASLGHRSLESSTLVPLGLAAILVNSQTGAALDVNDAFASLFGCERAVLIGNKFTQSYLDVMGAQWQRCGSMAGSQYGRSKRLKHDLYSGLIDMCVVRWRVHLANGELWEVLTTMWVDGWDTETDKEGRLLSRQPLRTVAVVSTSDWLYMDDDTSQQLREDD